MTVGIIGLGRMGQAIAARLINAGISVIGFDKYVHENIDLSVQSVDHDEPKGEFVLATSIADMAGQAHVFWVMVPQGKPVDDVLHELAPGLRQDAVVIEGGNSFFKDSIRRYEMLKKKSINYLDCGTSGGLQGREFGFSLMIGGDVDAYRMCKRVFAAVAAPNGYKLLGPSGAGHYVKMIHNGIEYGLLEAYAEGFHLLKHGDYDQLDLAAVSEIWNHGSIVRSWILKLAHDIFVEDQNFEGISGSVGENLTGLWTFQNAQEHKIPMDVLKAALDVRAESRKTGGNYATKIVALLRHEFGGHPITYQEAKKKKNE